MIKVTVNSSTYNVPTSWRDLTFGAYMDILAMPSDEPKSVLQQLAGIPTFIYDNLMSHEQDALNDCISFIYDEDRLAGEVLKFELSSNALQLPKVDFLAEPYEKYIIAKSMFRRKKNAKALFMAECILNAYCNLSILSDSVPIIYSECMRLISDYNQLSNMFTMYPAKHDPKAAQAGIGRFEAFGEYGALARLSGNDVLKMQQIKQLPTAEALQMLSYLSLIDNFNAQYATV